MSTLHDRTRAAMVAALIALGIGAGTVAVAASGAREPVRSNRPGAPGTPSAPGGSSASARSNRPGADEDSATSIAPQPSADARSNRSGARVEQGVMP